MIKLLIGLIAINLGLLTIAVTARFIIWILNEREEQGKNGNLDKNSKQRRTR